MRRPAQIDMKGVEWHLTYLLQFILDSLVVGGKLDINLGGLEQFFVRLDERLLKEQLVLIYYKIGFLYLDRFNPSILKEFK